MPQPPALPNSKKKRQRMIIIGAAAAGLLLILYIRSRSSSSSNATSATDLQTAEQNAAAQQAALDAQNAQSTGATPSTFADNGASTAQLDTDVTGALSGVTTALQNLQANQGSAAAAPAPTNPDPTAPGGTPAITVNNYGTGQPAGTSSGASAGTRMSTNVPKGDIAAPFGHTKPTAPKGYTAVGTGGGNWAFTPIRATTRKSTPAKPKK